MWMRKREQRSDNNDKLKDLQNKIPQQQTTRKIQPQRDYVSH